MSLDYCVHFDKSRSVTLGQWRAAIAELGYPLELPDELDPRETQGVTDCIYGGEPVMLGFFLGDEADFPSPGFDGTDRSIMEINFKAGAGEATHAAAVVAAASLCIATRGVIRDESEDAFTFDRARRWARNHFEADEITEAAMAFPHPDTEPPPARPPGRLSQAIYSFLIASPLLMLAALLAQSGWRYETSSPGFAVTGYLFLIGGTAGSITALIAAFRLFAAPEARTAPALALTFVNGVVLLFTVIMLVQVVFQ